MGYDFHPLADAFPMMEGAEFADLVASIRESGQRELIVLYDGKILDGRNRYRACIEVGMEPRTREFNGSDPVKFVIDANIRRRHLNESQRAMAAAEIARLQRGRPANVIDNKEEINAPIGAPSQTDAAELLNVSRRSVQRARTVIDKGEKELRDAVKQGHIAVAAAASVVEKPKEEQRAIAKIATETKGKKKRKPRGSRCPISKEPEPRHELDLRRLEVAWEVACDTARDAFLQKIGLADYDWRNETIGGTAP